MKLFRKSTPSKKRKQKLHNVVSRYSVDVRVTAGNGAKNNSSYKYYPNKKRVK